MKKAFVLFEAMNHMLKVLVEAHSRGYYIILLNHEELPKNSPYSIGPTLIGENIYIESWRKTQEVNTIIYNISQRVNVMGTYCAFEGALVFEANLRKMANLPHTLAKDIDFSLNKLKVRKLLFKKKLTYLKSTSLKEALEWKVWKFHSTVIVKPAKGIGSALVFKCKNKDELQTAAKEIERFDIIFPLMKNYIKSCPLFVVEEMARGELLSLECLIIDGKFHPVGLTSRVVLADNPVVEMGATFPYYHARKKEIIELAKKIHLTLNIVNGPTHCEFLVPDTGPIELVEINLRYIGGDALICMNEAFGFKFESVLVDVACGISPSLSFLDKKNAVASFQIILPPSHEKKLLKFEFKGDVVFSRLTKKIGQTLSGNANQLDHIAFFVVRGESAEDVDLLTQKIRNDSLLNGVPLKDNPNNNVISHRSIDA